MIHPTAIIEEGAQIAEGVEIGPFSIIGKNVKIGRGTRIDSHVLITGWTTIGEDNVIFKGAVIGEAPQDFSYKGDRSYVEVGDRNLIREYVTVHRAANAEGKTVIGSENLLMNYVHVAHNCHLGSQITIANAVGLAGHAHVEDQVVLGGMCGVHQFARIGRLCMVAGYSKVVQDVPPFTIVEGMPVRILGLNVHGMKKREISNEARNAVKKALGILTSRRYLKAQVPDAIREQVEMYPEVEHFIDFISQTSKKGILMQTPGRKSAEEVEEAVS